MTEKNELLDLFGSNLDLENEGVKVQISKNISVTLRRFGCARHKKIVESLKAPHKAKLRTDSEESKELQFEIGLKSLCHSIIVDWEGVRDIDTNEILPFNYKNAMKLLKDERMKDFVDLLTDLATERATFQDEEELDAVDNLKKSSAGKSSGAETKKSSAS